MSIPCPCCSRPNHERLRSCLYCGTELPPHDLPVEPAAPEEEPASHSREDVYLLVLEPVPERQDLPDLARALAPLLGLDPFGVRQRLMAPAPQVARQGRNREELGPARRALQERSIDCSLLSLSEILNGPAPFHARGLDPAGGGPKVLRFLSADGSVADVAFAGVEAVLVGRVTVRWAGTPTRPRRGKAIQDTPPSRDQISLMRSDYPLVDIHCRGPSPIVRIRVPDFDFSGLGEAKSPSSVINLKTILDRFRAASPSLAYNDSFKLLSPVIGEPGDERGEYRSNEEQFDLFSRTFIAHKRAIAPASSPLG